MKFDLTTLDRELFRLIHVDLHREWLDRLMLLITYTGDGWFHAAMILTMLAIKKTRMYGWACVVAFLGSGAIQGIAKELIKRPRPSNFDFAKPLEEIYGNTSFPSGHTTTSFAIAFMIAWMVKGTRYANIGWALCLWATIVAFSRVYIGIHYVGDCLGGVAIAGFVTAIIYLIWDKKNWIPETQESPELLTPSDQVS